MMQDGQGNEIGAFHEGDGTGIQTIYQGDGSVLWEDFDVIVIDDFEHGDLNQFYNGDLGSFEITDDDPVFEGDKSAKGLESVNYIWSKPGDGLGDYPQQGDRISAWINQPGSSFAGRPGILFGIVDHDNHYVARFYDGMTINIDKRDDGSFTNLAEQNVDLSPNTWYNLVVEWEEDDTITAIGKDENGNELESVTVTDGQFSGETGIGIYLSNHNQDPAYDKFTMVRDVL